MVDVFDRHEVRFDPRLAGCSTFVRHSDYAALEEQLARHPEPVVDTEPWGYWVKHKYAEGGLVRTPCFVPEESHYTEVLPLFTRPSEQAVTEAMVEAACRAWINAPSSLEFAMRAALKAAMEAGR